MMSTDSAAQARSNLFRLLALGFSHPTKEVHAEMTNSAFQREIGTAAEFAGASVPDVPIIDASFTDFEAQYIDLFQFGRNGRPQVSLNAGDYEKICDGRSRPAFMLEYTKWYRHFGLKTRDDPDANELPDHITCQLEFLSWLAHLEANADPESSICVGYQKAQQDFMERMALPFLNSVTKQLSDLSGTSDAAPLFGALAMSALAIDSTYPKPAVLGANP